MLNVDMLSVSCYGECRNAECRYAECQYAKFPYLKHFISTKTSLISIIT